MSEEKNNTVDVNSLTSSDKHINENGETHLELKVHTQEEIASSGKWYDQKYFSFLPQYSNSTIQVAILGFVVFMLPGMFNALNGIGTSISDAKTQELANVALYATFAGVGFFCGSIVNVIGPRISLSVGGLGYIIYAGSLLSFQHNQNRGFAIAAGAILGLCAGILWASQAAIIMSYPSEARKGRAIMIFWVIFNLGGVIGSIVPLANNINNGTSVANDGTYIAFMILMGAGVFISFLLLPPSKVYKDDNTRVVTKKHLDYKEEIFGVLTLIWQQPFIILLFPLFIASNWFYTYHFNDVNAARFTLRTRSLNSLLYWLSQMFGAGFFGFILDWPRFSRPMRAKISWAFVFVIGMAIWGGGYAFQKDYTRESAVDMKLLDFNDRAYVGPVFLYIFYGMYDAVFQTFCLWVLGALSNNPRTVALYGGMYKGLQSAGAAITWAIDSHNATYMAMFGSSWGLVQGSLIIAIPVILRIKETTSLEEDKLAEQVDESELKSVKSPVQ